MRNYPRYLKAVEVRLEKYRKDPSKDAEKAEEINKLTIKLNREKAARRGVEDPRLDEFENLLQELRVSLFAQELRTPMPVSVKKTEQSLGLVNRFFSRLFNIINFSAGIY